MRKISLLVVVFVFSSIFVYSQNQPQITEGSLFATNSKGAQLGACPLKNTSVKADVSGFLTRVTVKQEFENNFNEPIEAVYTFPLPQNAAVDRMTMNIGERVIRGKIMKREEARQVYEAAKAQGKTASLLDQERPNIFTQAVANILPNEKIVIEISYVETLKYEAGVYEFVFPMVVGPRYIPSSVSAAEARKISPPTAKERAGHDISIEVNLDAGVPVEAIRSGSHEIATQNLSASSAKINLKNETTIPNKDFVLRFDVTGSKIEDAILTHRSEKGGFFSLILLPPENFSAKDVTPKEIVFVLDTSGSMSGFPIEKAKEAMMLTLEGLNPQDTFNLITFAGETSILFSEPVAATPQNIARAKEFLASRRGSGGTEMMKAIRAALAPTKSQKHVRVVCFMTDGYVGNEAEIISEIQKYKNARVFSFGIGSSVNRYLLDKMAEEGRGEVEYVSLQDDGSAAAKRFYERIRMPLLTDISVDWKNLPVADVYPKRNPDLFSAKPVVINGRFTKVASGTITLRGKIGGQDYSREINVNFPETESKNDVLAALWARKRIEELTREDYRNQKPEIREQITNFGLEFNLLTAFTSFVAVEEKIVNENGQPKRVEVPVETPEGVRYESFDRTPGLSQVTVFGYLFKRNNISQWDVSTQGRRTSRLPEPVNQVANVTSLQITVNQGQNISSTKPDNDAVNTQKAEEKTDSTSVLSAVIKHIENHQKSLKSLKADLRKEVYEASLSESDVSEGSVTYLPSETNPSLRVTFVKPMEETLVVFGGNYVLYLPRVNRAISGKTSNAKIPGEILALAKGELKDNYLPKYLGQKTIGKNIKTWHLELIPKAESKFKSFEIWVDANGMIIQVKALEKNGNWTMISLSNLQKNTEIKPDEFKINVPKETKIIQ